VGGGRREWGGDKVRGGVLGLIMDRGMQRAQAVGAGPRVSEGRRFAQRFLL
jgi:hypothetical protein